MKSDFFEPYFIPKTSEVSSIGVLVHGYGASGSNLLDGLRRPIVSEFSHMALLAPNAPHVCDVFDEGFQWFPLRSADVTQDVRVTLLDEASSHVLQCLQAFQKHFNISRHIPIIMMGFSQGGAMTLHMTQHHINVQAAVVFSGFHIPYHKTSTYTPPTLWIHGDADNVVPLHCMTDAAPRISHVQTQRMSGMSHEISPKALQSALEFLRLHHCA